MNVASRARRILKHLNSYREVSESSLNLPSGLREVPLREGETILGIYANSLSMLEESIVVTNLGLHVYRHTQWESIDYSQIRSIETPPDKYETTQLMIQLQSDRVTNIPIRGGEGRFRDAFEFLRFLDRVTHDLQHNRPRK
jgi:hypothetical protein